jgi:alpha-tubulin suppressor-like RCC1 family protein
LRKLYYFFMIMTLGMLFTGCHSETHDKVNRGQNKASMLSSGIVSTPLVFSDMNQTFGTSGNNGTGSCHAAHASDENSSYHDSNGTQNQTASGNTGSSENTGTSNTPPMASDFNLTLDVGRSEITGDWKILSSASDADGDTLSASVVTQGNDGQAVIIGTTLRYLKQHESNTTDSIVLAISDGKASTNITIHIHPLYWKQISSGWNHTVALKSDGTVWSWGENNNGQLGDGTHAASNTPVQELSHATDWIAVDAGGAYSVALKRDGTLWSWGYNGHGELGNATTSSSPIPVQESTLSSDWVVVDADQYHTVALKSDGTLWSWGYNRYAQTGDGTTIDRHSPVQEATLSTDWKAVCAGHYYSAAIKSDGTLWSWGYNGNGQLGDGTHTQRSAAVQEASSSTDWQDIACGGYHTVARKHDDSVWSWGRNNDGQLGDGSYSDRPVPAKITLVSGVWKRIFAGDGNSAMLDANGSLYVFGSNNYAKLGDGTYEHRNIPVRLDANVSGWAAIAIGNIFSVALDSNGVLWSWGDNARGELGNAQTTTRLLPAEQMQHALWRQVATSSRFSAAIRDDGTLWLWGENNNGQLGDGTRTYRVEPVQEITHASDWKMVALGQSYTVALKNDGTIWGWGYNGHGELGDGTTALRVSPVQESSFSTDWTAVSTGFYHTVALKNDGTIWGWGYNGHGELGDGTTTSRRMPVQENSGATDWVALDAGGYHTAALKNNGTLWSWGYNGNGELGDGTTTSRTSPVQENSVATDWSAVSAGFYHTVALKNNGTLWAWGRNSDGQLGDSTRTQRSIPTQEATGSTNWRAISAGGYHTIGAKTDDSLWLWGANNEGQLANGTRIYQYTPAEEIAHSRNWSDTISAGDRYSAALKQDGTLWLWGSEVKGELGTINPFVEPKRVLPR